MKTIGLLILFFVTFSGKAQIVNIPDPFFKSALINEGVDTNGDGEIQISEAKAVKMLYIGFYSINSIEGIESFTSLTTLVLEHNNLKFLDLSKNASLIVLATQDNNLTTLDLSNNTNLTYVDCYNNNLESLNIKNGNNLNFEFFRGSNNPNLKCIQVDDEEYANSRINCYFGFPPEWCKDPTAFYSENCNLGITDVELNNEVLIYPIPVTETLYIESNSIIQSIIVFDILGKNLFIKKGDIKNIDFTLFPKGVYFLEITKENEKVLKRVIKQ